MATTFTGQQTVTTQAVPKQTQKVKATGAKPASDDLNYKFRQAAGEPSCTLNKLKQLFSSGKIDINSTGGDSKRTALHNLIIHAVSVENLKECLIFLLSQGANPLMKDKYQKTPLDYWKARKSKLKKEFYTFIYDILEIGRLIQEKKEILQPLLDTLYKDEDENFELILLCEDHDDNAPLNLLKERIDRLKDCGFNTFGFEGNFKAAPLNDQILEHQNNLHIIQQGLSLAQLVRDVSADSKEVNESIASLDIEQKKRINLSLIEIKTFLLAQKMNIVFTDPRLKSSDLMTPEEEFYQDEGAFYPLVEYGMSIVLALTLIREKKVINLCGLAHGQDIFERLKKMFPRMSIHAFFPHQTNYMAKLESSERTNIEAVIRQFSALIPLPISTPIKNQDLVFFDKIFKDFSDKIEQTKTLINAATTLATGNIKGNATGLGLVPTEIVLSYLFGMHKANIAGLVTPSAKAKTQGPTNRVANK